MSAMLRAKLAFEHASDDLERVFADGYCECRCGPCHHRLDSPPASAEVHVRCLYHGKTCAKIHFDATTDKKLQRRWEDAVNRNWRELRDGLTEYRIW